MASEASKKKIKFGASAATRLLWLLTLPFLAVGTWDAARFAHSDFLSRENTTESLREAVRLDPGNADFRELFAEHLEEDGLNPTPELKTAVALSPLDSHWWDRLGFQAESDGDYAGAERDLLEAARIDRTFGPRWALMNYYFRRGNQDQFWFWTKPALEMSYGDLTPIFRLCWIMSQDEVQIRNVLPVRREVLYPYLSFLVLSGRLKAAVPIALQTAELAESDDVPVLMNFCNQSAGKDNSSMLAVWNTLCEKKLLPFRPLDPAAGNIITDGDFSADLSERGFDWRAPVVDGVSVVPDQHGARVTLSGKQPEDCVLLFEPIPLTPGGKYRLNYKSRSDGPEALSGLNWIVRVIDPPGTILAASHDFAASSDWVPGQFGFTAGTHTAASLELHYKRPSGKVRWQGEVIIGAVSSELVR